MRQWRDRNHTTVLGKNRKTSTFFHSGGDETNFNALLWMLTLGHMCCSFAFMLVYISLIQGWGVKGILSIKNTIILISSRSLGQIPQIYKAMVCTVLSGIDF